MDEIEKASHRPHLAQPQAAKQMMARAHKTDALDTRGLAILFDGPPGVNELSVTPLFPVIQLLPQGS